MAQYNIKYACGHGSVTKQLYGKNADRERKIRWSQENLVCPDCYKAQKRAADDAAEQIIYLETRGIDGAVSARAAGRIEANKEALKAIGFEWSREYGGTLDLLATSEPPLALVQYHTFTTDDEMKSWLRDLVRAVRPIGYVVKDNISALDRGVFALAAEKRAQERADAATQLALNPRPVRPSWFEAAMQAPGDGKGWNGKFYGRSIYVNGTQVRLSPDQVAELEAYQVRLGAWRKAKAAADQVAK
jgi:hypothetical protein